MGICFYRTNEKNFLIYEKKPFYNNTTEEFRTWGFLWCWRWGLLQQKCFSCCIALCRAVTAVVWGRAFSTENGLPESSTELDDRLSTPRTVGRWGNTVFVFFVFFNKIKVLGVISRGKTQSFKTIISNHNGRRWFETSNVRLCYNQNAAQHCKLNLKPDVAI